MKKKLLVPTLLCSLAVAGTASVSFFDGDVQKSSGLSNANAEVVEVHQTPAADFSKVDTLVSFADNVFLGKVVSKEGTKKITGDLVETQFKVEVKKDIKGDLPDTTIVNQAGGFDEESNKKMILANDQMLEENKVYLFATRHNEEHNFNTVVPVYGKKLVNSDEEKENLISKYMKAKASKSAQEFIIEPGKGKDTGAK